MMFELPEPGPGLTTRRLIRARAKRRLSRHVDQPAWFRVQSSLRRSGGCANQRSKAIDATEGAERARDWLRRKRPIRPRISFDGARLMARWSSHDVREIHARNWGTLR